MTAPDYFLRYRVALSLDAIERALYPKEQALLSCLDRISVAIARVWMGTMLIPITVSYDAALSLYKAGFRLSAYATFPSQIGRIPAPSSDELIDWLIHRGYYVTIEMSERTMVASITKPWHIGGSGYSMADSLAALVEQLLNLEAADVSNTQNE